MFRSVLKIATTLFALSLISPTVNAMEAQSSVISSHSTQSNSIDRTLTQASLNTSHTCAMQLMPIAKDIYASVSPKVQKDSNLRKLMKKEIRPQVLSGRLSLKSARKNAEAASICLSLLKIESDQA